MNALSTPERPTFEVHMNSERREQIRITLRSLAEAHTATQALLEQTMTLLSEELALDPFTFWKSRSAVKQPPTVRASALVDPALLSVTFRGRSCFLGNSLPFRFFARLARRPNVYISHDELLSDVWLGPRSGSAIRSVVKTLRTKLRRAGMGDLADAIDGTVPGHYAIKLDA
jgi:hypothetical protein